MKIKNYLIANHTAEDITDIKDYLARFPFLQLAHISTSDETTISALVSEEIDLVILHIDLSSTGLSLLKHTIQLPPVIIVSSTDSYAVESYQIGKAADYILKPFTFDRLLTAVHRALSQQLAKTSFRDVNYIFLKMGRKIQRFDYEYIDYIEAYGIYSKVVYRNQMFVVNERMAALSDLLPSSLFLRVHKSYIINVSKISSYDRNFFHVDNEKIPIGVSFRPKLEGLLRLFENN